MVEKVLKDDFLVWRSSAHLHIVMKEFLKKAFILEGIVSRPLSLAWPPRSPDFPLKIIIDCMGDAQSENLPKKTVTRDDLNKNIRVAVSSISIDELSKLSRVLGAAARCHRKSRRTSRAGCAIADATTGISCSWIVYFNSEFDYERVNNYLQ